MKENKRDFICNDYVIVDVSIMCKLRKLGIKDALCLMMYAKILMWSWKTGYCHVTRGDITDSLYIGGRLITTSLKKLKRYGAIEYKDDGWNVYVYPLIVSEKIIDRHPEYEDPAMDEIYGDMSND